MFMGGLYWRLFTRHARRRATCDFVAAVNARKFDRARQLLADDLVVADLNGHEISGADDYIEAERAFRTGSGNPHTHIDTLDYDRGDVLIRGHKLSEHGDIDGPTMWRVEFHDRLIARIEMTRPPGKLTVVDFKRRQDRAEEARKSA